MAAAANERARNPRGETVEVSLAAGMCWVIGMLGVYAQPQLLESIMEE